MAGHHQVVRRLRPANRRRRDSHESGITMNETFFSNGQVSTQSQTWKSSVAKEREQFERRKTMVKRIAPEQFQSCARPTGEPCEIVPRTYEEWMQHQSEVKQMEIEEMKRNIKIKQDLRKAGPDARTPFVSAFAAGSKFEDGRSAVLSQMSIWTAITGSLDHVRISWPKLDELRLHGDSRENGKTRCGRFLPPPCLPAQQHIAIEERALVKSNPLDQIGPLHQGGLGPVERLMANKSMDADPGFELEGAELIGESLMREVGCWLPPYVPEWSVHRQQLASTSDHFDFRMYGDVYEEEPGAWSWIADSIEESLYEVSTLASRG